ncbi:MAG: response regulator [Ketobacter sp.]|uniref:response regulator n=1 Tax=Ketobacter sp. MCCC 1A13808 TaxID=2602738 RepID=UPI002103F32A|nr:response regulator [Ketobacter sp. MCCC 1A13808]
MYLNKAYIICVDDDRTILMSLRAQLRHWYKGKYAIEIAESAPEGLELIQELLDDGEEIKAVISDWMMPGMKGDEFLIKVHKQYPTLLKIMLSGHADPEAVQRTEELTEFSGCINKPWTREDFFQVIPFDEKENEA